MSECSFSLNHYRETLERAVQNGYRCISFDKYLNGNFAQSEKIILMRHDVDGPIEQDLALAEIEKDFGVTSTFFIRLHAVYYNALSVPSLEKIKKIMSYGSEIGLHYEPVFPSLLGREELDGLKKEKSLLDTGLDLNVRGLCPHEPMRTDSMTINPEIVKSAGFKYQAYDQKFLTDFKYISDSSCRWREGCFCEWIGKKDRLYVLTHGFWWFKSSPLDNY